MHWHSPWAFWLCVIWLALIFYYFFWGRQKKACFRVSSTAGLVINKTWRIWLIELPILLLFITLLLLIVALARPQKIGTYIDKSAQGIDIMLVLDTSDSMLVKDMSTDSRLTSAKKVITNFINELVYDRVGLIVFSGESYTRVPLTLDYAVVLNSLQTVQTSYYDPYIKPGTAIGVALANAVARLRVSSANSKVIIFLTDGDNNTGVINPETALGIVKQYGIKVYTIGVGSKGDGQKVRIPVEVIDASGQKRTVYQIIQSRINEKLLKKIAKETNGKYFRADHIQALENIFTDISRLEKTPVESIKHVKYHDLFPVVLKKALFIFLISLLLMLTIFWRTV